MADQNGNNPKKSELIANCDWYIRLFINFRPYTFEIQLALF